MEYPDPNEPQMCPKCGVSHSIGSAHYIFCKDCGKSLGRDITGHANPRCEECRVKFVASLPPTPMSERLKAVGWFILATLLILVVIAIAMVQFWFGADCGPYTTC